MASNFPNSASVGQQFTVNGVTRQWDGTAWISVATTVAGPQGPVGPTSVAASVTYATTSGSTQQTTFSNMNVSGNLSVTGNIYQSGSIVTISASNLEVADSVIYLSASNYYSDLLDIGFYGAYGAPSHNTASDHYHTGLIRNHNDGIWNLFSAGIEPTTGSIDFNTANFDTLKLGGIEITSSALVSNLNAQYLNSIPSSSFALKTYVDSQDSATLSSAQTYANSASLNSYNNASAFAVTNANSASSNAYNQASAYARSASLTAYNNASAFAVTQSNSASLNAYNLGVTYTNSASLNAYNQASAFAVTQSNSASLNSYNQASAFAINADQNYYASAQIYTSGSAWNNQSASVKFASSAGYLPVSGLSSSVISIGGTPIGLGETTSGLSNISLSNISSLGLSGNSLDTSATTYFNLLATPATLNIGTTGAYGGSRSINIGTGSGSNGTGYINIGATDLGYYTEYINIGASIPATVLYSRFISIGSASANSTLTISANSTIYGTLGVSGLITGSITTSRNSASLGGISAADYALDSSSNIFTGTQTILTGASANKGIIVRGSSLQTANLQEWQNSSSTALVGVTASGYIYSGSLLFASTATQGSAAHLSIYAASSNPSIILRPAVTPDPNSNHVEIYNTPTATSPTLTINKSGQLSSTGITGQSSGVGFPITAVRSLPNNGVLGLSARQSSSVTHTSDLLQIQQATTYLSFAGITASGQIYTGINTASGYTTVPLTNTSGSYAQLSVSPASSANPGVIIKAKASQTANLQEWQNSSGSTLSYVNSNGQFVGDGSLLTGTGIPIYYSSSANTASFSPAAASSFPLLGLSTGSVALAANTTYKIDMEFVMQSVSSAVTRTASLQFLSTSPLSSLGYFVEVLATTVIPPTSATATSNINIISSSALLAIETARSAAGTLSRIVRVKGTLRTGTASTALSPLMQFSSNPETNITFLQGSYMSFIPLLGSTSNGTWG
jgi:hypothetical protein